MKLNVIFLKPSSPFFSSSNCYLPHSRFPFLIPSFFIAKTSFILSHTEHQWIFWCPAAKAKGLQNGHVASFRFSKCLKIVLESDVCNMYLSCQRCLSLCLLSQESSWIENCSDRNELSLKRGRESGFSVTIGQDVTYPLDTTSQPTPPSQWT